MNVDLPTQSEFWKTVDEVNFGAIFLYTTRLSG